MNTNAQNKFDLSKEIALKRIHRPTPEEFKQNFLSSRKPVIITGQMSGWKALSLWTADYLNAAVGDTNVDISVSQNRRFTGDLENGFTLLRKKMKFGDFMNCVLQKNKLTDESYYLQQQPIATIFPDILQDIEAPDYFTQKLVVNTYLWLGGIDNISPLHYDASDNLLAQVSGRKRILLFDPQQTSLLYPFPAHSKIAHLSQINIDQPDLEKFPKFPKTRYLECILEPGEMLFIPSFWWHQVYSLDKLNISVNFWWKTNFRQFFTHPGRRLAAQIPAILWDTFKNMVSSIL